MKSCKNCKDKAICKKPCEWLEKILQNIEVPKEHLTFTELGIERHTLTAEVGP